MERWFFSALITTIVLLLILVIAAAIRVGYERTQRCDEIHGELLQDSRGSGSACLVNGRIVNVDNDDYRELGRKYREED